MSTISWERVRTAGSKLTTPLHPDDYLSMINPLWSQRELRGRVEQVISETEDAATLVIRPGWGWHYDHRPGQYVGIGVQVEGKFQWRSYSVSSPPKRSGRTISITVRAMPEGLLSAHLVEGLKPGTIVRLALPEGDFVLPDPPPAEMLFLVGGSGIWVSADLSEIVRQDEAESFPGATGDAVRSKHVALLARPDRRGGHLRPYPKRGRHHRGTRARVRARRWQRDDARRRRPRARSPARRVRACLVARRFEALRLEPAGRRGERAASLSYSDARTSMKATDAGRTKRPSSSAHSPAASALLKQAISSRAASTAASRSS